MRGNPTAEIAVTGAKDRSLTPREHEVAELIGQGFTNGQIAAELTISRHTAERHVENILAKLDVGSRVHVATWMVRATASGSLIGARP